MIARGQSHNLSVIRRERTMRLRSPASLRAATILGGKAAGAKALDAAMILGTTEVVP